MAKFKTSAALQGGYYGRDRYDSNLKQYVFDSLGKQVTVEDIIDNIETQSTSLQLSFVLEDGTRKCVTLSNKGLGDGSIIGELADVGADVTKENTNIFIDSLRLQKENIANSGRGIRREYDHVGWINLPVTDCWGRTTGSRCCYRASKLIGHIPATYVGDYAVKPMGSWDVWRQMVFDEILGNPLLEVLMVIGLSAVVNGLISPETTGENPLIHIAAMSSSGKSTLGKAIVSCYGPAFTGQRTIIRADGTRKHLKSWYRSWGATETSITGGCAGNRGAAIVFNELGKLPNSVNLTNILYHLSEAGDKDRGNEQYKVAQTESYFTTIVSLGEFSLLEKIGTKDEGLRNRVMEIAVDKLTNDAEHSRRINDVVVAHNGHAGPKFADYIIGAGGLPYVMDVYKEYRETLPDKLPATHSKDRFVEKFVALFMTTAELASVALDIPFNLDSILKWFYDYELENGDKRNTSKDSYHFVVEQCHVHVTNFFYPDNTPRVQAWGAIKRYDYKPTNGKLLVEEILIRRTPLEDLIREYKHQNVKSCLDEWYKAGFLSRDKDKPTRSRKVDPNGHLEDVYVIRVFGTPPATNSPTSAPTAPSAPLPKIPLKPKLASTQMDSKLRDLLADEEDDDNE